MKHLAGDGSLVMCLEAHAVCTAYIQAGGGTFECPFGAWAEVFDFTVHLPCVD